MGLPSKDACDAFGEVAVAFEDGLHMRPAMSLVDRASTFSSEVSISDGNQCVDGKSIMQITMLGAAQGTMLTVCATGDDADAAVEAIVELLSDKAQT